MGIREIEKFSNADYSSSDIACIIASNLSGSGSGSIISGIESNCCEIVNEKEEANIFINGAFHNDSSNASLVFAMITGFSMYIIPSWGNSKMRVSAKVENGKISKEYDLNDSMLFAQWLPFIVVPIFAGNQIKVEGEVNKNLYKTLLAQIKKDGFFGK